MRVFRTIKIDPEKRTIENFQIENDRKVFDNLSKLVGGSPEFIPFHIGKKRVFVFMTRSEHYLELSTFNFSNLKLRGVSFLLNPERTKGGNIKSLSFDTKVKDIKQLVAWEDK